MITIYKNKKDIPQNMEYIELNDVFFNQNTVARLEQNAGKIIEQNAGKIIEQIDGCKMISQYKIESKFNGVTLDIDCLSTGCKTVLNVLYFPDRVFCLKECGDNALEVLYHLEQGRVYSDYATIPFEMDSVNVSFDGENKTIADYEALKEWWKNEK